MNKTILIALSLCFSVAQAEVSTISVIMAPTMTVLSVVKWTQTGSSELKRLSVAAKEEAIYFIQTEGMADKSVVLNAALEELSRVADVSELSEIEMAKVLVAFSTEQ